MKGTDSWMYSADIHFGIIIADKCGLGRTYSVWFFSVWFFMMFI